MASVYGGDHSSVGVVGIGFDAKLNCCLVGFSGGHHVLAEPSRRADAQNEYAGCHRIERSGVADTLDARSAPDTGDYIVAGQTLRFVDNQETKGFQNKLCLRTALKIQLA